MSEAAGDSVGVVEFWKPVRPGTTAKAVSAMIEKMRRTTAASR